ncbi:family S53 protease [Auriscalpium vulgare]|uniref:Family S53 protease n=1 Tax=Auriscalpium vulgare TaxID=40419 RepID=A0ACB8RJJ3_9AGAM|nr:family S53 protease [Auriscalpium vulgare]
MRLHERRAHAPEGFTSKGPAPSDKVLSLRLALKQTDIKGLQDALYDVSTPGSAKYGQHLSKEEVHNFVAPTSETVNAVNAWLAKNGLTGTKMSPHSDWIGIQTTVEKANELFDAQFTTFTHDESGVDSINTLEYSIPGSLKEHINLVHPTTSFSRPLGPQTVSIPLSSIVPQGNVSALASCSIFTPSCLQSLYGIPATAATQKSNSIAVSGFLEQFANRADLESFLAANRKDMSSSTTFTLETLDSGHNNQTKSEAGSEADLDIQYTVGLATSVPTVFISVGEAFQDGRLDGFLDIVNHLLDKDIPNQVMTTSYGFDERDMSDELAHSLCNAYAQLGALGTTVLFSSGDGGVAGTRLKNCTQFVPTFPGTCPFVTTVGATAGTYETAAGLSAGGFSNIFSTPDYQIQAKATYLGALGSTYSGLFNSSGRGYPDVAAIGENVAIVTKGNGTTVDGTSCSTPIFASVVALLNDRLIAAGKPPLGFLNPLLYSAAGVAALNDITSGSNPGCGTTGFPADFGWDPVTGLGSPNFAKLLELVMHGSDTTDAHATTPSGNESLLSAGAAANTANMQDCFFERHKTALIISGAVAAGVLLLLLAAGIFAAVKWRQSGRRTYRPLNEPAPAGVMKNVVRFHD